MLERECLAYVYFQGNTVSAIVDHLCLEDGIVVSEQGLCKFLKHYTEQETVERKQGSGCPSKTMPGIQQIIENAMRPLYTRDTKWVGSTEGQHTATHKEC